MKDAELSDLLMDWKEKATWGDQQKKIEYLNKIHQLMEDLATEEYTIMPYQTNNGEYNYRLRIGRTQQ